ncbi:hypothetical protein C4577_02930 [Candidatus Parcubacteria bacterium]|nr:MAG: hypothetical protein C4577_02930 [Candidatus Parcubacteria bacterium]
MDEYQSETEAPCIPGGNYGLCKTHPTCESIQNLIEGQERDKREQYKKTVEALVNVTHSVRKELNNLPCYCEVTIGGLNMCARCIALRYK